MVVAQHLSSTRLYYLLSGMILEGNDSPPTLLLPGAQLYFAPKLQTTTFQIHCCALEISFLVKSGPTAGVASASGVQQVHTANSPLENTLDILRSPQHVQSGACAGDVRHLHRGSLQP